jgi:hypothetical protein
VSTFFREQVGRAAIVNGIWVGSIAHDPCKLRMLTGTTLETSADLVTMAGSVHGAALPLGSVDLSGVGRTGPLAATAGSVGGSSQIETLLAPSSSYPSADPAYPFPLYTPSDADVARVRARALARWDRVADRFGRDQARIADYLEADDRAARLLAQSGVLVDQLKFGAAPSLATMVDLATDLLAEDLCAAALIDTNTLWDTHYDNEAQNDHFEKLFQALNVAAASLDAKGLAGTTTIAVMSEMTRTPKHNPDQGKDHWQHTSALLFGAGVRPGQYGATDDLLESLPMDLGTGEPSDGGQLCRYDNFIAGILALVDVDPERFLPGVVPFTGMSTG